MTIDHPSAEQIPALRSLWKEAFGDPDAYLDLFFSLGFSARRCRCVCRNGQVLGVLYWFETFCEGQRFAYLYAIATAAAHRGRGIFSALLRDTQSLLQEEGYDGILLVPQSESLFHMYKKFGFAPCTAVDPFTADAGSEPAALWQIEKEEYRLLRRALLPESSVLQEGADLSLVAAQCRFYAGDDWIAAARTEDGCLICPEFLGNTAAIPGFLKTLNCSQGNFRMPGSDQSFAMLLPLRHDCVRPAYFGFALD